MNSILRARFTFKRLPSTAVHWLSSSGIAPPLSAGHRYSPYVSPPSFRREPVMRTRVPAGNSSLAFSVYVSNSRTMHGPLSATVILCTARPFSVLFVRAEGVKPAENPATVTSPVLSLSAEASAVMYSVPRPRTFTASPRESASRISAFISPVMCCTMSAFVPSSRFWILAIICSMVIVLRSNLA